MKLPLLVVSALSLALVSPVPVQAWTLAEGRIQPVPLPNQIQPVGVITQGDLDQDSVAEKIQLTGGKVAILRHGASVWLSPDSWEVTQALVADLNQDGSLEAALLVWRPFSPWPIDRYIPHPGRIDGFHDAQGRSCQVILIGGSGGSYHEVWAGSALAEPVTYFAAADLNGDRYPELVTLDGHYADRFSIRPRALSIWEWNGFGFSLITRLEKSYSNMQVVQVQGAGLIIVVGP